MIKLIDINQFVNIHLILKLLQKALLQRKCISADDVYNTRVRAKLLIRKIEENGNSIDTFQYNEDMDLGLLRGLDDVTKDIIDKAKEFQKKTFKIIFMIKIIRYSLGPF